VGVLVGVQATTGELTGVGVGVLVATTAMCLGRGGKGLRGR